VAMVDYDRLSAHWRGPRARDAAVAGAVDRGADGNGDVDAFVQLSGLEDGVGAVAEGTGDPRVGVDGPGQLQSGGQREHIADLGLGSAGVGIGQEAGIGGQLVGTGDSGGTGPSDGTVPHLAVDGAELQRTPRTLGVELLQLQ